jgi:hypothetical protein
VEHQAIENKTARLAQEWVTLQTQHEQYEQSALLIKLTGVVLVAAGWVLSVSGWGVAVLVAVLWVQESIYRTCQARLGERLLRVEQFLKANPSPASAAFQLHSEWLAGRPGLAGLLAEYAASARRPTVAFPHVFLMLLALVGHVVR